MAKVFSPAVLRDILDERTRDASWLAAQTGATPTTVAQWLAGVTAPRGSSLRVISMVLRIPERELLVDE